MPCRFLSILLICLVGFPDVCGTKTLIHWLIMLLVPPLWIWSTDHLLWLIKDDQNKDYHLLGWWDDDQPIAFCWLTHFCLYKNQCLFRIRYLFITLERNKWKKYYKFQLNNMHKWLCKAIWTFSIYLPPMFSFSVLWFPKFADFSNKTQHFFGSNLHFNKENFQNFQIFLLPSASNSPKRNSLNLRYLFLLWR